MHIFHRPFFLVPMLAAGLCGPAFRAAAQPVGPDDVPRLLQGLRKEHPRLLLTREDQQRIQTLARTDPFLQSLVDHIRQNAEARLAEPPIAYKLVGPRLLDVSRECLGSVLNCALTYRLTGDRRFADRAKLDLLTAAGFADWHPPHFLDTAEMTAGVAIGYDWLYDYLTPEERKTIRTAIVEHGLKAGLEIYPNKGWADVSNNWNEVCNGGMTLGALAVADEEPAVSETILRDAVASIPRSLASYAPEGVWEEGPNYWDYGTSYTALFISGLKSALGTDGGFPTVPGLDKTGFYELQTIGPNGLLFNFGDGGSRASPAAELFWLGQTFNEPALSWFQRQLLAPQLARKDPKADDRLSALNVIWYDARGTPDDLKKLPLDQCFHGHSDIVALRSAWNDPQAIYVGFKAGRNAASHSHLDLGTFVLDADGQRWAMDLGSDYYNLPGYFDAKDDDGPRWKIFRLMTASHNTLLIGNRNQPARATANMTSFKTDQDNARAVADLSPAYAGQASAVRRGIALLDHSRVLVQDELQGLTGQDEVRWGMVTPADASVDRATAVLTQHGITMKAEILSPAGAGFEIVSTKPKEPAENQNVGTCMLAVRIAHPPAGAPLRIAVLLTPQGKQWPLHPPPELKNLDAW